MTTNRRPKPVLVNNTVEFGGQPGYLDALATFADRFTACATEPCEAHVLFGYNHNPAAIDPDPDEGAALGLPKHPERQDDVARLGVEFRDGLFWASPQLPVPPLMPATVERIRTGMDSFTRRFANPTCTYCGRAIFQRSGSGEWIHPANASAYCEPGRNSDLTATPR